MEETITKTDLKRDHQLGCKATDSYSEFRIFCPRAKTVMVEIFDRYEDSEGQKHKMNKNGDDVWQVTIKGNHIGKFYGYRIIPPTDDPAFSDQNYLAADPWSKMTATRNDYLQHPKSLILQSEEFDWQGDSFITPKDPRDLVIYETHLKDLTAHPSSESKNPGTYAGVTEQGIKGGINHLKNLGVNAVEFLPLQKFAFFEPPHNEPISEGVINTWNYYGRNYWGYMTSFFFVPETIYASDGSTDPDAVNGRTQTAIREFKTMIRELHKAGMTVIMDVVYNHVSQYDLNPFKQIDKDYYFRKNEDGSYRSDSGCGNDFRTEAPMARKLIIDSIKFWMQEFHIDGFRFDLANLIDAETLALIRDEARKINPDVILIAEPWGGGYNPTGFSELDYPSWNDQIRNGVKGSDPKNDRGFIFGGWQWETSRDGLENMLSGTLLGKNNGRYHTSAHSVNYLESHDGYTLGDFIRIGLDATKSEKPVDNRSELVKLSDSELQLSRLAAVYLFASQGITMIHAGQEWSRTKVIVPQEGVEDPFMGLPDHNSYEKDNETNYLNFNDINPNKDLVDYYRGLIHLRLNSPALRKSDPDALHFWSYNDSLHLTLTIHGESAGDPYDYIVSLNGNPFATHKLDLPIGLWEVVVSDMLAQSEGFDIAASEILIPPSSGYILRRLRSKG